MKITSILESVISEVPLKDFEPIGDFSKGSSFRDPRDRKMITNPKFKEIVAKKFGKTEFDINLYFVNTPKGRNHTEVGAVDLDWVRENLGDEVADKVEPNFGDEDEINVIFTNNSGAERINMTPWIMAHRIGHALSRFSMTHGGGRQFRSYQEVVDYIGNEFNTFFQDVYGIKGFNAKGKFGPYARRDQLLFKHLAHNLGTFKSARDNNMREYFELYNELFAQYLITGKVTMNDLPERFKAGNFGDVSVRDKEAYEELKDLGSFENTLNHYFQELLFEAQQHILVM